MKLNGRQLQLGLAGALMVVGGVLMIETHSGAKMSAWNPLTCPGVYIFMLGWAIFVWSNWSGRGLKVALPSIAVMMTAIMGQLGHTRGNASLKLAGGIGFTLSWLWLAWALGQGRGFRAQEDSRIFRYGGAAGIVLSMNYLMAKQRKTGRIYGAGLPLFGFSWAMVALGGSIIS